MRSLAAVVLVALVGIATAGPAGTGAPNPELTALQALEEQLDALRAAGPELDRTFLATLWAFAHPENRARTGPLERFAAMLRSRAYAPLVGHRERTIEAIAEDDLGAGFLVTLQGADGQYAVYAWFLIRSDRANCFGCWLTAAVAREALPPSI